MKWVFWTFVALYLIATLLFLSGNFGWFGQARDPLAGVFLMPLGMPWNIIADRLLGERIDTLGPVVGLLSPAINATLLYYFWRK